MNYATLQNYKGETIAECAGRFREQHGLFAEQRARLWSQWFEGMDDPPMAVFYRMVEHVIIVGVELTIRFPNRVETVKINRNNFTWDERGPRHNGRAR